MDSAQITQIRLPHGRVIALVDWSDMPLFSTVDLGAGFTDQTIQAFNYIVSDQVSSSQNIAPRRAATDRDTNISSPGTLAATEEMLVYNVKVEPYLYWADETAGIVDATSASVAAHGVGFPIMEANLLAYLHARLLLQLEISQKLYANASLGYFNEGFGVFPTGIVAGAVPVAGSAGRSFGTQGFPSADAPRSFTIPVHIGGQENYRVRLENSTGDTVPFIDLNGVAQAERLVSLRIYLEGLYKRPVS
jgi:hypothetical protein